MRFKPTPSDTFRNLYGAWRIFWLDRRAVGLFENTPEAFLQSFWCAVILLPAIILLRLLQPEYGEMIETNGIMRLAVIETISYVIIWTAWPVAAAALTSFLDREDHYFHYIGTFNWLTAPLTLLHLILSLVHAAIGLPDIVITGLTIGVIFWSLFLHGFVARTCLNISGVAAIPLVVFDFLLGIIILYWRTSLLVTPALP